MGMTARQIEKCATRILYGIQVTNDVQSALNHLIKTAIPLKDQEKTKYLAHKPETPLGKVSWMLKFYDITEDQIRTCLFNATLPLPGNIEITPDVRVLLDQMVQGTIHRNTLEWANTIGLVHRDVMNPSAEESVNNLIMAGTDKINSAGPHYQFSWLLENYGYSIEQLVEFIQTEECDTSSGLETGDTSSDPETGDTSSGPELD